MRFIPGREIRRYVASLNQSLQLFGHHRPGAQPEAPEKQIGHGRTEEELDSELAALENETGDAMSE
jgi:hypothetical protein